MPPRRRIAFSLIAALAFYAVTEAVLMPALFLFREVRPEYFVHAFIETHFDSLSEDDRLRFLELAHDPVLGWDNRPLAQYRFRNSLDVEYGVSYAADGSRADHLPDKRLLMHTYGDSFTWCDEVGDHETWQRFLEVALDAEVKNFGVGAYGTHQAILKFERHVEQSAVAPITVLGIMEENINRTVNLFRPFYSPGSGVKLGFKPALRITANGRIESLPNPYSDPSLSLPALRELAHRISDRDPWSPRGRIDLHFPYALQFLRAVSLMAKRRARAWLGRPNDVGHMTDLWAEPEGEAIMHHLTDEFVHLAKEAGSKPVILFIPRAESLREPEAPAYAEFVTDLRGRHPRLTVIDLIDHAFDRERFNLSPYRGHASAYGNRVIADIVARSLREAGRPSLVAD